ncbi:MAG: hypothetical protein V4735_02535 [Pseudomonadota bacterium]
MQPNHPQHRLPTAAVMATLNIDELMNATLRLSDILAEETAMLVEMRFNDLPKTHEEKVKLTRLLEQYQNRMASDPSFMNGADEKTREELLMLADDLAYNVEENFRRTAVARAVNERVMQAIMDVLGEKHRPGTYGANGQSNHSHDLALSLNLNQKA